MPHQNQGLIVSTDDFEKNPTGDAERWQAEMSAANKETADWHRDSEKIVDRFLDKRQKTAQGGLTKHRLNFFTANIQTLRSMLYGNLPIVDAKRRFDDADDDLARVAGNILQRMLNADIQRDDDDYSDVLRYSLDDRLTVGLGVARVRYQAEFETVEVPPMMGPPQLDEAGQPVGEPVELVAGFTEEKKTWEEAPVDYIGWRDVRWSPARVWGEVRWIAFRAHMTRDQVDKRFGEGTAAKLPFGEDNLTGRKKHVQTSKTDSMLHDAWQRVGVWEIWCKEDRKVHWYVEGYAETLDIKPDPLKLEGFWPCPKFMVANETTSSLLPRPDFTLHRDLYNEIDYVSTRIERLERTIKAVGVYDKKAIGVQRMLTEAVDNDLIPVDNWQGFSEQGGIAGAVDWMPLAERVEAMDKLREYRSELIELLNQLTGMSDILRGAASTPNVTATEQGLKARYSSVRVTALQDMFTEFASDLQRLRAQVIINHFDDETILARSNIMKTADAPMAMQALKMLRENYAEYRVSIQPDNIARADYAVTKSERTEYLTAIGGFIQQAMPLIESNPASAPALIKMMSWAAAGFRGGQQIETVLDEALKQVEQSAKQAQGGEEGQDPEAARAQAQQQAEQAKAQAAQALAQLKGQQKMAELDRKFQADMELLRKEHEDKLMIITAELQADREREEAQAQMGALETQANVEGAVEQARRVAPYLHSAGGHG